MIYIIIYNISYISIYNIYILYTIAKKLAYFLRKYDFSKKVKYLHRRYDFFVREYELFKESYLFASRI